MSPCRWGRKYSTLGPRPAWARTCGSSFGWVVFGRIFGGSAGAHFESPVPSSHDRDAIGVKWSAHDENDDQLVYSVYYRGDGETRWLLLKDNID
jgi:hypothetical protein